MPREAWLSFKLPEFSDKEILWHEALDTMVLNVYKGKLYVVGVANGLLEYQQYGRPEPDYIAFRHDKDQWVRIPFNEIPEAIYDANMWFENMVNYKIKNVTIDEKDTRLLWNKGYMPYQRRIDPKHISNLKNTY